MHSLHCRHEVLVVSDSADAAVIVVVATGIDAVGKLMLLAHLAAGAAAGINATPAAHVRVDVAPDDTDATNSYSKQYRKRVRRKRVVEEVGARQTLFH